ncbi:MAG: hypothetical protein OIF47_13590 [Marinibacterium sp.]|nr:hypothetical protein [Marinibacterium sp.]
MTWLATLVTEGWPILLALGMVSAITFGALRPYLKKDAARRREMEQQDD